MRHEIRLTWVHFAVFAALLVLMLAFVYAQVDQAAAWHTSNEVRVFIRGYGYMTLQEAIDSNVITAGRALEADRALRADQAGDADFVDNQKAQTIIDGCTYGVCISGVCVLVKGEGADQCTTHADCAGPSGPPDDPYPSTPYLSVWDGSEYKVDNDFMFGWSTSFWPYYEDARAMYEDGAVFQGSNGLAFYDHGDLLRLQKPVHPDHKFQMLEYDDEESYLDELKLLRVSHDQDSEIVVEHDLSEMVALSLEDNIVVPYGCVTSFGNGCVDEVSVRDGFDGDIVLDNGDFIDVTFKAVPSVTEPKLLITSRYRGWRPSRIDKYTLNDALKRLSVKLREPLLPTVIAQDPVRSIQVFYYDSGWQLLALIHPKDMTYYTEYIDLPAELVAQGTLMLRLVWTEEHDLDFVGIVPDGRDQGFDIEVLEPTKAYHHRLQEDLTDRILEKDFDYLHTIRGDVVDLEFEQGTEVQEHAAVTYVLKSEGFYTNLRAYLYPDVDFDYVEQFWNP